MQARVDVAFRMTEGKGNLPLMVGKVFPHQPYGTIFFHSFSKKNADKQSKGQEFYSEDCPCPVDDVVVRWCREQGISHFYAYDEDHRILYRAEIERLAAAEVRELAKKTIRRRHMLPREVWASKQDVHEIRHGWEIILACEGKPIMTVPWVNGQVRLSSEQEVL